MAETPNPSSPSPSRSSTPNPRFTAQAQSAEDLLKEQTVGLVHLSDFRKRRAEAFDHSSRDGTPGASGATTPDGREPATKAGLGFKKRKKVVKKSVLSFDDDETEDAESSTVTKEDTPAQDTEDVVQKKRLKPNSSLAHPAIKAQTKSSTLREAALKDSLRREYALIQEAVKATEFCLPFVFFDGKNHEGGVCRMKKGDAVWLFLERARKVGVSVGGGGGNRGVGQDWARISVDDLMLVRGGLVVGHHYDFHYFILNRTTGYDNTPLFPFSGEPTAATPQHLLPSNTPSNSTPSTPPTSLEEQSQLTTAATRKANQQSSAAARIPDSDHEGFSADPNLTKVVDRRWYERNKHIYPASTWEDFDPAKDYGSGARKDGVGNSYFFSR